MDRIYRGIPINQNFDENTARDYTYISDAVNFILRAIDTPLGCEVINIASGKAILLKTFIDIVEREVGVKGVVSYLRPGLSTGVLSTHADIHKACSLLNYTPKVYSIPPPPTHTHFLP
jgi:UDP-glucuronate 4-epimerase